LSKISTQIDDVRSDNRCLLTSVKTRLTSKANTKNNLDKKEKKEKRSS
jgi:hypothetical protein